ncbi:DUF309 domain-containing protein [Streptomyces sp. 4.24]
MKPRDRDAEGRARSARPRDGLGRPLPYGAQGVGRQPEGVVRTPAESVAQAQRLLDAGKPFHAHEVFEDAWKSGPEEQAPLWRGLAQLAVGLTHSARGNAVGGARLLRRGADVLAGRNATGADPAAAPGTAPSADPGADPSAEPGADPSAEPPAGHRTVPSADPAAGPRTVPSADPRTVPSAEPGADPSADPGADPSAEAPADHRNDPPAGPGAGVGVGAAGGLGGGPSYGMDLPGLVRWARELAARVEAGAAVDAAAEAPRLTGRPGPA